MSARGVSVVKLRDLCESVDYGYTASASVEAIGPHFLRITDIVSSSIDWQTVPYVAGDACILDKYGLRDGDIVIARTGASTGASAFIMNPPEAVFASYLVRLKVKPAYDPRYVFYCLRSPAFLSYLHGVLGDKSAQPNASASTMTAAPLPVLTDIVEQRSASSLLGMLDDKIELNRKMSATLEAMARALFKSWFVDFDPVCAKAEGRDPGLPPEIAVLFPDSFEDSEIGDIPKGWQLRGLDEIARFLNGLALQKYPALNGRALQVIKIAQLRTGSTAGADEASADLERDYIVSDGDVLFSWSGSLECVLWTGGKGALNQHLFKVTSTSFPKWFFYLWIHRHLNDFRHIAAGKATTMGHIQRHHLSAAKTVIPAPEVLKVADCILSPLVERIITARLESRTLAHVRDMLLPKLISGELRVRDAERFVEQSA